MTQGPLHGQVHAIAVRGNDVYVAGVFDSASGVPAGNIARWNGGQWSALGAGLGGNNAVIRALAVDAAGNLYAGGFFTTAGGNEARSIAKWDGASWSALGTGVASGGAVGEVRALAVVGDHLYVGGAFNNAGGIATTGIARWTLIPARPGAGSDQENVIKARRDVTIVVITDLLASCVLLAVWLGARF